MTRHENIDVETIEGFGDEWTRFTQSELPETERAQIFESYFSVFPWDALPFNAEGFDLGCGSGRWAQLVAPRVARLHCIDPSVALEVARRSLAEHPNCVFHRAAVDSIPLEDGSMDFGYSLGVLHHVPDTQAGLHACVGKLKPGAPFLVYLYYAFDNRPLWFRALWRASDILRRVISRLPHGARYWVSQVIAVCVYLPLARTARILEKGGLTVAHFPLSAYRNRSFYTMRTDALDRFGTRLERRFTRKEILQLMARAGLDRIEIAASEPYWCAVGYRR
jgi:SAM-dependent methyltransferase